MQEKMQKNTISNISVWLSNKLSGNGSYANSFKNQLAIVQSTDPMTSFSCCNFRFMDKWFYLLAIKQGSASKYQGNFHRFTDTSEAEVIAEFLSHPTTSNR